MNNEHLRGTVIRWVRVRENLKPVKAYWHRRSDPDWLVITHLTGQKGYESFSLQFLKVMTPVCDTTAGRSGKIVQISEVFYETLRIAKAQAHADIGIEYVEWEPCNVEITNEDGSIDWDRMLPIFEHSGCV